MPKCPRNRNELNAKCQCDTTYRHERNIYDIYALNYKQICRCPVCDKDCSCSYKEEGIAMKVIIPLLMTLLLTGCISASSSTGTETQSKIKAEQSAIQASGQDSSNTNKSESLIVSTNTEYLNDSGAVVSRTNTTEVKAGTGSEQNQNSELFTELKNKLEFQNKTRAEAEAKTQFNLNIMLMVLGILVIFSVGSRTIWPIIKKFVKPI